MPKSPDAFRTISEVADWLGVQAHVLRFWESKFTQIKPIKRAGGRRYYRPSDMLLLGGIKKLLHDDGLTIKGVQKLLREHGMSHVADLSQPLDDDTLADLDGTLAPVAAAPSPVALPDAAPEKGVVLPFDAPPRADADAQEARTADTGAETPASAEEPREDAPAAQGTLPAFLREPLTEPQPEPSDNLQPAEPQETVGAPEPEDKAQPDAVPQPPDSPAAEQQAEAEPEAASEPQGTAQPEPEPEPELQTAESPQDAAPAPRGPARITVPPVPDEADIVVSPGALSSVVRIKALSSDQARDLRPLAMQLTALRDRMTRPRKDARKD